MEFEVINKKIGKKIKTFLLDYDKSAELINKFVKSTIEYRAINNPKNVDMAICYLKLNYKNSEVIEIKDFEGNPNGVRITTTGTYSDACRSDQKLIQILLILEENQLVLDASSEYKYYIRTTSDEALRWYLTTNPDQLDLTNINYKFEPLNKKPLTLKELAYNEWGRYEDKNTTDKNTARPISGGSTRKHKYHHIQNRRKPRHRHKSRTNKRRRTTRGRK
jgi:hypothetical protein